MIDKKLRNKIFYQRMEIYRNNILGKYEVLKLSNTLKNERRSLNICCSNFNREYVIFIIKI